MGELHLEIIVDRMKREFGVEANVGTPQVAYRETIRKVGRDGRRQVRQAVGRPRPVRPRVAQARAAGAGQGLRVRRRDQGRLGAARVHPGGAEGHATRRCPNGVLAGFPVVDVKVTLLRRLVPRGRLERERVQDGGLDRLQGRHAPREPDAARADHGGRGRDARGLHGQRDGRPVLAPRHDPGHGRHGRRRQGRSRPRCRSRRCSATRRRCARSRRAARRTRWNSSTTPKRRRTSPNRSSTRKLQRTETRKDHGQGQIRADQAARERGHDRSRGPRQDDADGGDHDGAVEEVRRRGEDLRPDRRGAGGEGARDHDQHGARGVRDEEPSLRARGLPGPRGLREEHDHGCGADGRGDPGGVGGRRPDAADARAHPAGAPGGCAVHRGVHEQGGHGRRQGAAGAGGDGGARAAVEVRVSRATTRRS